MFPEVFPGGYQKSTGPAGRVEQITYLMFIRELDVVDNEKSSSSLMLGIPYNSIFDETHQLCRWSQFKNYPAEEMYKIVQEQVFPFIKGLHGDEESAYSKYMADAIFKIPTPQLLEQIVTAMDEIDWKDSDIRGDLYEYLLSKIATAGTNGQFRTPRHIIRMMVDLVTPNPEDVICDHIQRIGNSTGPKHLPKTVYFIFQFSSNHSQHPLYGLFIQVKHHEAIISYFSVFLSLRDRSGIKAGLYRVCEDLSF